VDVMGSDVSLAAALRERSTLPPAA
jgi:hypothetical protein